MLGTILTWAMMRIVVGNAENGEVLVDGVRMVAVDVVKLESNPTRFANATHAAIFRQ